MDILANKKLPPSEQYARLYMRGARAYGFAMTLSALTTVSALGYSFSAVSLDYNDDNRSPAVSVKEPAPLSILGGGLALAFTVFAGFKADRRYEKSVEHRDGRRDYGIVGNSKEQIHAEFKSLVERKLVTKKDEKKLRLETLALLDDLSAEWSNCQVGEDTRAIQGRIESLPDAIKFIPS